MSSPHHHKPRHSCASQQQGDGYEAESTQGRSIAGALRSALGSGAFFFVRHGLKSGPFAG